MFQWASMHDTRTLNMKQLNLIQLLLIWLFTHLSVSYCDMSTCLLWKKAYCIQELQSLQIPAVPTSSAQWYSVYRFLLKICKLTWWKMDEKGKWKHTLTMASQGHSGIGQSWNIFVARKLKLSLALTPHLISLQFYNSFFLIYCIYATAFNIKAFGITWMIPQKFLTHSKCNDFEFLPDHLHHCTLL